MTTNVNTLNKLRDLISKNEKCGILFVASNHGPSQQMSLVVEGLAEEFSDANFAICDVSYLEASRAAIGVTAIPQLWIVLNSDLISVTEGSNAQDYFAATVSGFSNEENSKKSSEDESQTLSLSTRLAEGDSAVQKKVAELLKASCLLVAGRGSTFVEVVEALKTKQLTGADVLDLSERPEMAEALASTFSCTVYLEGEAVDGLSFLAESMVDSERVQGLNQKMDSDLKLRILSLVRSADVMLFMKGTKQMPFCKFSKEMVRLLNLATIEFDYFNVFEDARLREELKLFSDWPTYPQLYVKGDFIGGLDILKETIESAGGIERLKEALDV